MAALVDQVRLFRGDKYVYKDRRRIARPGHDVAQWPRWLVVTATVARSHGFLPPAGGADGLHIRTFSPSGFTVHSCVVIINHLQGVWLCGAYLVKGVHDNNSNNVNNRLTSPAPPPQSNTFIVSLTVIIVMIGRWGATGAKNGLCIGDGHARARALAHARIVDIHAWMCSKAPALRFFPCQ